MDSFDARLTEAINDILSSEDAWLNYDTTFHDIIRRGGSPEQTINDLFIYANIGAETKLLSFELMGDSVRVVFSQFGVKRTYYFSVNERVMDSIYVLSPSKVTFKELIDARAPLGLVLAQVLDSLAVGYTVRDIDTENQYIEVMHVSKGKYVSDKFRFRFEQSLGNWVRSLLRI
jgi:hypothetical protein